MAMTAQAGMATSKVIILVLGAGMAGPMILGKANLSDVISSLQGMLLKSEKNDASQNSGNEEIQAQIMRLAQELRQLYGGRQITVVNESNQSNGLSSYIVPMAVVGAAGYCYMWWKGWSLSDMMYVTKKNMANVVSSFTKQLEQVSAAVAAAKRQLSQRMEKLNDKLDEQKEVTGAIKFEVGEVREKLAEMGLDIDSVQRLVEGLGSKIDKIEGKQDLTNAGVVYLCHFVQGLAGGQRPELLQSSSTKARLDRSPSGFGGLKELQYFSEALKPNGLSKPASGDGMLSMTESTLECTVIPGGTVHRTFKYA
ncbi:hypothetical protein KP509_03G044300 [Ceratopteris richardii]|uniref:DUF1664 domain-containing protein n=2 Tax=Ceratopteris richardii TaxID=49495 RepID=A0A8T2VB26_CERRI|nr:hypothetical protein KP509_03G044300 [Ceratopteris richardii]